MQRLVWQNANGDVIDLTSGNYGITNWEGFSNTSLNIQSQQVPFQDGGVFLDALMEQRELSVTLAMQDNNNLETRYRLRRELIHALNPKSGEGFLIYTNDFTSKRIKCVAQIPLFETHNSNDSGTPKASLSWTACEPYWEDLEKREVTFQIGEQPIINNEGDVPVGMQMEWFTSYVKNGSVTNIKTNKKIKYNGELGESLNINTETGKKTVFTEQMKFALSAIGNQINKIIYSNGLYIAVGENGLIMTSPDGNNWTSRNNEGDEDIKSITHSENKGLFVAVALYGIIYTSTDGFTWSRTSVDIGTYGFFSDVVYSEDKEIFVAVGSAIWSSTDGINWTQRQTLTESIEKIAYFYHTHNFCAGGYTSTDGITWVQDNHSIWAVYSQKLNLYVTTFGYGVSYSTDLTNWIQVNLVENGAFNYIAYSEDLNIFVAVGYYQDDNRHNWQVIYTSTDGVNWTGYTLDLIGVLISVTYSEELNMFMAVGEYGTILTSYNGLEWSVINNTTKEDIYNISYFNGLYIGVGNRETIITSPDGRNWTVRNTKTIWGDLYCVMYFEETGKYIAYGEDTDYESIDGINWNVTITNLNARDIKKTNTQYKYIQVSDTGIIRVSTNGTDWIGKTSGTIENLNSVIYSEYLHLFVIVGDNGIILTSPDGDTWTVRTSGVSVNLSEIVFSEDIKIFVAVGENGQILTSSNGINWYIQTSNTVQNINGVYYSEELNMFMAVGNGGTIITSSDGYNWKANNSGIENSLYSVIFNNDSFYIAGSIGVVLNSFFDFTENKIQNISADSDMNLGLQVGINQFRINKTDGNMVVRIKYRQKYIGV